MFQGIIKTLTNTNIGVSLQLINIYMIAAFLEWGYSAAYTEGLSHSLLTNGSLNVS